MSGIGAEYAALSVEQQAFLEEKTVDDVRPPSTWLELLDPLAEYDARADRHRSRMKNAAIAAGLGGAVVAAALFSIAPVAGAIALPLAIAAFLYFFVAWRRAKRHDLPNAPLAFAVTVVSVLSEDVPRGGGLRVRLDMRGPLHDDKRVSQTEPYARGAYHKIVDTYYDDPWFGASCRFADDTQVALSVVDRVRSSKRTKKNINGKTKTKVKRKRTMYLQAVVSLPGKNYQPEAEPAETGSPVATKVKVTPGEGRTTVRLAHKLKLPDLDAMPEPDVLVNLVAAAYDRVRPARRKSIE